MLATIPLLAFPQQAHAEAKNPLTDDQYAAFGLHLQDPPIFSDTSDPLAGFEPTEISELYLGTMNAAGQSHYEGSFRVLDETDDVSADELSVNASTRTIVGNRPALDNHGNGFQTQNTCAVDVDGDGKDEIAELTLYTRDKGNKSSQVDVAALSYYTLENNTWKKTELQSWNLTNPGESYIQDIDANTSKSYVAIAAGNYDTSADGSEEIAFYVASRANGGAFVGVYSPASGMLASLPLAQIDARFDVTASGWTLGGTYMPVVGLATTSISGQDDLVVNVSNPLKSGPDQRSALVIYRLSDGQATTMYADTNLTSSANHRMRFCSAIDADLLGNGTQALVVGGYENYDFSDNTSAGKLSSKNNMVQLFVWDSENGGYRRVWDDPQDSQIALGSKLTTSTAMMEPAAIAAGRLRMASASERVFLEGSILRFTTEQSTTASTFDMLRAGTFLVEQRIAVKGDNSAFISQAEIAHFSKGSAVCEQLVVLQGDENTFHSMNDKIYYDISWTWEENGQLKSTVTDNDLIESDQDDNGTYASICALDCDDDQVIFEFEGCDMGWSAPELYCVLQSPPYWRELLYDDAGSVSFEISSGEMDGRDWDFNVGIGLFARASVLAGAGFLGNDGKLGASFEVNAAGQFVHEHSFTSTDVSTWRVNVSPGQDHAVVYAIPIVNYRYRMYVPEYVMTEQRLEFYNENKKEGDPNYQVGDTVPGSWQDMSFTSEGQPTLSHLTLEKYNTLVAQMGDATDLRQITPELLPRKTIGDPSTYPRDQVDLKQRGNVKYLEYSATAAQVSAGTGETELSFTTGYENEDADGFHIDAEGSIALAGEYECSLIFASSGSFEAGGKLFFGGGTVWTGAKSHEWGFSSVFADLPEGTDHSYDFSSNMAVYTLDLADTSDDPYCIAFTAATAPDEALPPVLPAQLRVFGTTSDAVLLRWERGESLRAAKSWEVFVEDNNGIAQSLGIVNAPVFLATNLDPATTYSFSLRAYSGEGGTGVKSSRSAWLSATTKEADDDAPSFTTRPANVAVEAGAAEPQAMTAAAAYGAGMQEKGASLTFQWQRFSADSLSVAGSWEDIGAGEAWTDEGGNIGSRLVLPTLTGEGGSYTGSDGETYGARTYYRVMATQRVGANVHSIISRSAAMVVGEAAGASAPTLSLLVAEGQEGVHSIGPNVFFDGAECAELRLAGTLLGSDGVPVSEADVLLMARSASEEQLLTPESDALIVFGSGLGEHVLARSTTSADGTASFAVPTGQLAGTPELYVVYEGKESGGNWAVLPAQSDGLLAHAVVHRQIGYDAGEGTSTDYNPFVITSLSDLAKLKAPLRRGFTFEAWHDAEGNPLQQLGAEDALPGGQLLLHATYSPISYPISYELNGGVNSSQNPSSYTVEDSVRLQPAVKDGKSFEGWYLDAALTQRSDTVPLNHAGPITFYAAWSAGPDDPAEPDDPDEPDAPDDPVEPDDGGDPAKPDDGDESRTPSGSSEVTPRPSNASNAAASARSTVARGSTPKTGDTAQPAAFAAFTALGVLLAVAAAFTIWRSRRKQ